MSNNMYECVKGKSLTTAEEDAYAKWVEEDDDKTFGCYQCYHWFKEGKDACKKCNFDLNCYNEEEVIEEDIVYVVKTWEYKHQTDSIEYAGLWEDENGNKEFKTEEQARVQYEFATDGQQGYCAVSLVKIEDYINQEGNWDKGEICIEDWKKRRSNMKV